MFTTILFKELKNFILTFKFSAALITATVLLTGSAWVLGEDYVRRLNTYTALADDAAMAAADNYIPSRIRPNLHRPPSPLSIFAQGEEKRLGNSVEISRWEVPVEASDSLTDNMLLLAQPPFDMLMIFNLVISLFALLLTYDTISGEKEAGTLKLMILTGPRRPSIYLSKFIAALLVLSIPVLTGLLMSLIVLSFVHGVSFAPTHLTALLLMMLAGLLYGAVFIAIGMLCSTLVPRSSTALVMSLFVWTVLVLFLPASAQRLAASLHPLKSPREISDFQQKSYNEVVAELQEQRREKWSNAGSGWGSWNTTGESPFLFDSWPDAWRDTMGLIRFNENAMQKRAQQIYNLQREHLAEKRAQLELSRMLQFPSPSYHLRRAFTSLAATDLSTHEDFMERVRKYRADFLGSFRDRGFFDDNVIGLFSRRNLEEVLDEAGWEQRRQNHRARIEAGEDIWSVVGEKNWPPLPASFIPAFSNGVETPDMEGGLFFITALVLMVLILFSLGYVNFIGYDVR